MAIGDAAAGQGMSVVPATEDLRKGFERINETRDYLANHQANGGHHWGKITGKPSSFTPAAHNHDDRYYTEAEVNTALGAKADAASTVPWLGSRAILNGVGTRLYFTTDTNPGSWIPLARVDEIPAPVSVAGKANAYGNENTVLAAQRAATPGVTRTNRAVWMNADGDLGQNTSSRRYKAEIRAAGIDLADVLALQPVTFRYRKNVTDDQTRQLGLIAEDVPDSLAPFLVILDADGQPDGVRYESALPVMLLAAIQTLNARITDLEGRLTDALGR